MTTGAAASRPRIAMVSVGIDRIQRGFERYYSGLFGVLRDHVDITLFKCGGAANSGQRIPRLFRPVQALASALPLGGLVGGGEYRTYKRDCLALGLSLLPELLYGAYDIVQCVDPPLAAVLDRLQRRFHFPPRLLFTEGSLMPAPAYPSGAHIHHVAQAAYREALIMGVPESRMTLVPCGFDAGRFAAKPDRGELRARHGIPESTFVILVVSAVKRIHKRVHYVIDEVSRLDGDVLLWIDGNPEDPAVLEIAFRKLGPRCRITHVPSVDVPELYRLADVFAHGALEESFGLAVVEAMSSGLPVLVHDSPHFEWLTEDREFLVDMRVTGNLALRLRQTMNRREEFRRRAQERAPRVQQRFDWRALAPAYVEMYRKVAASVVTEAEDGREVAYGRS